MWPCRDKMRERRKSAHCRSALLATRQISEGRLVQQLRGLPGPRPTRSAANIPAADLTGSFWAVAYSPKYLSAIWMPSSYMFW